MLTEKTYYKSEIGLLEIIATDKGISKVDFLNQEPSEFSLETNNTFLKDCFQQLAEYFRGERKSFSLELDPKGTDFEKRVWQELLKISFGETITYLHLAERLGDKKVIRAAARANGKNPLAIIIPCHRVIGSDGSLTGYAGGLWRKEWLLKHEGSRQATLW
ncbi:MAG: methylated-DNA--[protein]-cysteine S-methyltransferase [Acidobacteria bacterium]|nr:methylated-DNA--[protein]-cysteine S-methyltransferase [Acidobacteriota bacterium]